jgi:hypothetical protein
LTSFYKSSDRPVVELRLQGHTIPEVSRLVGGTERTVRRVLAKVRARLEADSAQDEEAP